MYYVVTDQYNNEAFNDESKEVCDRRAAELNEEVLKQNEGLSCRDAQYNNSSYEVKSSTEFFDCVEQK